MLHEFFSTYLPLNGISEMSMNVPLEISVLSSTLAKNLKIIKKNNN